MLPQTLHNIGLIHATRRSYSRRGLPQALPRPQGTPGAWRFRLGERRWRRWGTSPETAATSSGRSVPATRAGSQRAASPAQSGSGHRAQQPRKCGPGSGRPGRRSRTLRDGSRVAGTNSSGRTRDGDRARPARSGCRAPGGSQTAERLAARAVAITGRIAPNSAAHAFALRRIARLARDRGDLDRAAATSPRRSTRSNHRASVSAVPTRPVLPMQANVAPSTSNTSTCSWRSDSRRARSTSWSDRVPAPPDDARGTGPRLDADLPADLKQTTRELREDDDRLQESLTRLNPRQDAPRSIGCTNDCASCARNGARSWKRSAPRHLALPHCSIRRHSIWNRCNRLSTPARSCSPTRSEPTPPASSSSGDRPPSAARHLAVHAIAIGEAGLREQVAAFRRLIERDAGASRGSLQHSCRSAAPLRPAGCAGRAADRWRRSSTDRARRSPPQLAVRSADEEERGMRRSTRAVSGGVEAAAHDALGDGLRGAQKGHACRRRVRRRSSPSAIRSIPVRPGRRRRQIPRSKA